MIEEVTDKWAFAVRTPVTNKGRPVIAPSETGCSGNSWFRSASEIPAVEPSSAERGALLAGMRAGDTVLARLERVDVLQLFVRKGRPPLDEPRLAALRAYAELRRALLPPDWVVPAASLSALGFTSKQSAQFDAMTASPPARESEIE